MQRFTVKTIRRNCCWINGVEAHLDSPVIDSSAPPGSFLEANGWIASATDGIKRVILACRGRIIAEAKLLPRPDVEQAYPDRLHVTGFDIGAVPAVLGAREPLKIAMTSMSGRHTTLFEIELEYSADEAATRSADFILAPIVALPRSGTTLLSELLHSSPSVLGDDQYPYELRLGPQLAGEWFDSLQPWSHVLAEDRSAVTVDPNYATICRILRAADTDAQTGAEFDRMFEASRCHYREKLGALYRMSAPKPAARIIAEKVGLGIELDLLEALAGPIKPIFLIRDPRDLLVSMRRFNEKRGVYEFHEARTRNYGEVLHHMAVDLFNLTDLYDRCRGDRLLVRYEDLARQPATTLREILGYLGAEAGQAQTPGTPSLIPDVHVTSASIDASIGRWQHDLTPGEAARANWHLRPFLERFGFA